MKLSKELQDIMKDNRVREHIANYNFEYIIEHIVKNYDNKLNIIYEFVNMLKYYGAHQPISLNNHLNNVFENSLDCTQNTSLNTKIHYPQNDWRNYLRSEISPIIHDLENLLDLRHDNYILSRLQNIKIVFSDSRKTIQYGTYNKQDILDSISTYQDKHYSSNRYVSEILQRLAFDIREYDNNNNERDKYNQSLNETITLLEKQFCELPTKAINDIKKIITKIKRLKFNTNLLGTFSTNKTITLYIESIFDHAVNNKVSFLKSMLEVFVHELFHAYHFFTINNTNEWKSCNKIIKESFAAYFEYLYCKSQNIYVFNLERDWQKYDMYTYPYSGAQYLKDKVFNTHDIGSIRKANNHITSYDFDSCVSFSFSQLFKLSLLDSSCALKVFDIYYLYSKI